VRLRRYRDEDRQAVWELHTLALEQAGGHQKGPWDDDLGAIAATYLESGGEFLVGVEDARIVAIGAFRPRDDRRAEIKRMRVHPAVQRRGFGRRLLHRLEQGAVELGYRTLILDTTVEQEAAQALYRGEGYKETGRGRAGPFELILFEKRIR
jgi:ribosomal protein S18 acetylase RimI-like enzyme